MHKNRLVLLSSTQLQLADNDTNNTLNAEEKYRVWLFKRYIDYKELLISSLINEEKCQSDSIKIACINSIFELIKHETLLDAEQSAALKADEEIEKKINFPFELFHVNELT